MTLPSTTTQPLRQVVCVVFHGLPKPDDAIIGIGSKWYRPLRPAPWLQRYLE